VLFFCKQKQSDSISLGTAKSAVQIRESECDTDTRCLIERRCAPSDSIQESFNEVRESNSHGFQSMCNETEQCKKNYKGT